MGGRENRAPALNSSACTSKGIFNNPWEGRHAHTYTENRQKHARTRVRWLWHFLSAPLSPPPSSPSHQRQQDSLPAWGNERSLWREEDWGGGRRSGGKRKKADAEAGSLTQPPPPEPQCVDRIWILSASLHKPHPKLRIMYLFSLETIFFLVQIISQRDTNHRDPLLDLKIAAGNVAQHSTPPKHKYNTAETMLLFNNLPLRRERKKKTISA